MIKLIKRFLDLKGKCIIMLILGYARLHLQEPRRNGTQQQ